jgi:hypothetical protein
MHVAEWAPAATESNQDDRPIQRSRIERERFIVNRAHFETWGGLTRLQRLSVLCRRRDWHVRMPGLQRHAANKAHEKHSVKRAANGHAVNQTGN